MGRTTIGPKMRLPSWLPKFYTEKDHIPSYVVASPSLPSLNVALSPQNAHPFSYSGLQLMSTYSLRF